MCPYVADPATVLAFNSILISSEKQLVYLVME